MKKITLSFILFTAFILTANSYAHTGLESSVPNDNAMLMQSLEDIELHFGSAVNLIKLELINKADGQSVDISFTPTTTAAAHFSHPMPALKIGTYQVNWTAMGSDGHKMEGNFSFMMHVDGKSDAMPHSNMGQMHDAVPSPAETPSSESDHSGH